MQALLGIFFTSVLLSPGGTLRCETCTGETACTGEERNCSEGQNACGSTLTEGPKGDTTFSSLVKGCLSSDLCKIPVEVRLGEDKYLRQTTICCWRDACASEPPDLPRTSQKINGKFCPACASSTDVCPEEYVYCTGDHAYCLGFVTVTETNVVNSTMKGCISESSCFSLKTIKGHIHGFANMRNVSCTEAKVAQATRAFPSPGFLLLTVQLMKLLL